MNLQSIITSTLLSGAALDVLSKKTNMPKSKLKPIVAAAIPLLLGNMTKNASSKDGAACSVPLFLKKVETAGHCMRVFWIYLHLPFQLTCIEP